MGSGYVMRRQSQMNNSSGLIISELAKVAMKRLFSRKDVPWYVSTVRNDVTLTIARRRDKNFIIHLFFFRYQRSNFKLSQSLLNS